MLSPTLSPRSGVLVTDSFVAARRVLRVVLATIATLLTLSVAGQVAKYVFNHDEVFGLVRLTFVSAEGNLPTFYSAVALLTCAGLLWVCGQVARAQADRFARHWIALSLIFLYLSVDEASRIHELTGQAMKRVVAFDGFLYYPWVLVGSTAVFITTVSFFSFVRSLPPYTRRLIVAAAAVFVGGAIGVEMLAARHASAFGAHNLSNSLISTVEEGCEMVGIALFMYALIRHLEASRTMFVLRFGAGPIVVDAAAPELASSFVVPHRGPVSPSFEPALAFNRAGSPGVQSPEPV